MSPASPTPTRCHRDTSHFTLPGPSGAFQPAELAAAVIRLDGRQIKNVAAESRFAYFTLPDTFIGVAQQPREPLP